MAHTDEISPVPGWKAFTSSGPSAVFSRAAFLLVPGRRAGQTDPREYGDEIDDDERMLEVPELKTTPVREGPTEDRELQAEHHSADIDPSRVPKLVDSLYERPSLARAASLIEACMYVPAPLIRVAAATAHSRMSIAQPRLWPPVAELGAHGTQVDLGPDDQRDRAWHRRQSQRSEDIIVRGVGEENELVRDIATTALEGLRVDAARWAVDQTSPDMEESEQLEQLDEVVDRRVPNDTSLIVHGTIIGPTTSWWKPGRVFHKYLKGNVCTNLYGGSRPFRWSGLYNHRARHLGAQDLLGWSNGTCLDHVIAYSHGGSVAMLASKLGLNMNKLVLLSCPVHARYAPDFDHVSKVVSVRTRLDLVILADRGGQRFHDKRISENVLPLWFSHKATREVSVWKRYGIASML